MLLDATPALTDLRPQYWTARVLSWAWQGWQPLPDSRLAGPWTAFIQAIEVELKALQAADNGLWEAFAAGDALRFAQQEALTRETHARHELQEALTSSGPRFQAEDPDARAWRQAADAVAELEQLKEGILSRAEEHEQQITPEIAGLLERRFGHEDYNGGMVQHWSDKRLAAKIGFEAYDRKRWALGQQLDRVNRQLTEAHAVLTPAKQSMERAWQMKGAVYLDEASIAPARQALADAEAERERWDTATIPSDMNPMARRQALIQAVARFHKASQESLVEITMAVMHHVLENPEEASSLPDIDRVPFLRTMGHADTDLARKDRVRKASNALFEGLASEPDPCFPVWITVAYGNTEGLPGSALTQASLSPPPLPPVLELLFAA